MEITYYGQSCFLFKIGEHRILFDPFISPNELAKDIDVDSIKADYILLSHGHQDHVHDAEGPKPGDLRAVPVDERRCCTGAQVPSGRRHRLQVSQGELAAGRELRDGQQLGVVRRLRQPNGGV